mgnify:FL=1|tara:strand:+ start:3007 stop:3363 length:357 start_codon:yes stop_codon:yes gene_type:complete
MQMNNQQQQEEINKLKAEIEQLKIVADKYSTMKEVWYEAGNDSEELKDCIELLHGKEYAREYFDELYDEEEPIIEKPVCADCKKGISFCRTIDEKDYCLQCAVKYEKPLCSDDDSSDE